MWPKSPSRGTVSNADALNNVQDIIAQAEPRISLDIVSILLEGGPGSGRCGDRMLAGAIFTVYVQICHEAYSTTCTMGIGSFRGKKRPGRGAGHPLPSSAEVANGLELDLRLPYMPA